MVENTFTPTALPPNYPADWVETVTLKDGVATTIRPILPEDAVRLQEGFLRLSPETIYFRFLEAANQLSDGQARRLATLDYQERMALVASIQEDGVEQLIGVARYAMVGAEYPGEAETAVVVRDDYQGRGLGTLLYQRLIRYAQGHGVKTFAATIHQSNARIMSFIRRSELPFERQVIEPGVILIMIQLDGQPEQ